MRRKLAKKNPRKSQNLRNPGKEFGSRCGAATHGLDPGCPPEGILSLTALPAMVNSPQPDNFFCRGVVPSHPMAPLGGVAGCSTAVKIYENSRGLQAGKSAPRISCLVPRSSVLSEATSNHARHPIQPNSKTQVVSRGSSTNLGIANSLLATGKMRLLRRLMNMIRPSFRRKYARAELGGSAPAPGAVRGGRHTSGLLSAHELVERSIRPNSYGERCTDISCATNATRRSRGSDRPCRLIGPKNIRVLAKRGCK